MFLINLIWFVFVGVSLYGVIRLAVRHAINDSKEDSFWSMITLDLLVVTKIKNIFLRTKYKELIRDDFYQLKIYWRIKWLKSLKNFWCVEVS